MELFEQLFEQIDQALQIISFRNTLTHEYVIISDQHVWGMIHGNLPAPLVHRIQFLVSLDGIQ